jgi:hypothetical protein
MRVCDAVKRILCSAVIPGMLAGAMLVSVSRSSAQQPASAQEKAKWVSPNPDLSGFWEPKYTGQGSGAFGDVFGKVPKAELVPGRKPAARPVAAAYAYGAKAPVDGTACSILAFPFYQTSSPPWEILQNKDEIVILAEREMGSRHVYMDGRGHPAHQTLTSNGDSIGHWDGKTLVVDTTGFRANAAGGVPGGGAKGPNTHLTERYTVVDDPKNGEALKVDFKWEDPSLYAKPHEYTLTYYKMPKDTYALEDWCDAGDPIEYQSANGVVVIGKDSVYNTPQGQQYNQQRQQRGGTPETPATPKQ